MNVLYLHESNLKFRDRFILADEQMTKELVTSGSAKLILADPRWWFRHK